MTVRRLTNDAFAEAFSTHARALWCVAAGILGHRDVVEDVLQEGALIALRKLDQFDPDTSFFAWMGRIVRYVALNQARRG
ncbi:MAG: RNA polymerase subunit sigma-70, partial [Phycisphaerae bacterium]|nr:RNA polymerase subunit sigma-70 [Phycisphaerae bacterium]